MMLGSFVCLFFVVFFHLGFKWLSRGHQDYFTHFEPSQLEGGAKTGDPQEKPPDHLLTEFDSGLPCNPGEAWTHSGEMTSDLRALKISHQPLGSERGGVVNDAVPVNRQKARWL